MKKISLLLLIAAAACVVFCCSCSRYRKIVPDEDRKGYTLPELEQVFSYNKEEFVRVGDIMLNSEKFGMIISESCEWIASIETDSKKDLFTEDEWDEMTSLFRSTGLSEIRLDYKAENKIVRFVYYKDGVTTSLYYCPDGDELDMAYYSAIESEFERIEDHWWVGSTPD